MCFQIGVYLGKYVSGVSIIFFFGILKLANRKLALMHLVSINERALQDPAFNKLQAGKASYYYFSHFLQAPQEFLEPLSRKNTVMDPNWVHSQSAPEVSNKSQTGETGELEDQ